MTYQEFLQPKRIFAEPCGFEVEDSEINPRLFPFQRDIVRWACRRGKAAVFAHTGLGKGPIQLEWCQQVCKHAGGTTLIAGRFVGIELKESYFRNACANLEAALRLRDQGTLDGI